MEKGTGEIQKDNLRTIYTLDNITNEIINLTANKMTALLAVALKNDNLMIVNYETMEFLDLVNLKILNGGKRIGIIDLFFDDMREEVLKLVGKETLQKQKIGRVLKSEGGEFREHVLIIAVERALIRYDFRTKDFNLTPRGKFGEFKLSRAMNIGKSVCTVGTMGGKVFIVNITNFEIITEIKSGFYTGRVNGLCPFYPSVDSIPYLAVMDSSQKLACWNIQTGSLAYKFLSLPNNYEV